MATKNLPRRRRQAHPHHKITLEIPRNILVDVSRVPTAQHLQILDPPNKPVGPQQGHRVPILELVLRGRILGPGQVRQHTLPTH